MKVNRSLGPPIHRCRWPQSVCRAARGLPGRRRRDPFAPCTQHRGTTRRRRPGSGGWVAGAAAAEARGRTISCTADGHSRRARDAPPGSVAKTCYQTSWSTLALDLAAATGAAGFSQRRGRRCARLRMLGHTAALTAAARPPLWAMRRGAVARAMAVCELVRNWVSARRPGDEGSRPQLAAAASKPALRERASSRSCVSDARYGACSCASHPSPRWRRQNTVCATVHGLG